MLYVELPEGRYPVAVFAELEALLSALRERAQGRACFLVTDAVVDGLHAAPVAAALASGAVRLHRVVVGSGEGAKSVAGLVAVWDELIACGATRGDLVVALGGGVVGDLTGFAAATMLRGLEWIQVPTTLLAMCDAAIGGKTAINHGRGKNLVGAFHQPAAVLSWIGYVQTLPAREVRSGLAEVVKSALIDSEQALASLEADAAALAGGDLDALRRAAELAAAVKVRVVSQDPREQGLRRVLNLGHTLGHALEHAVGYGGWTHGECVAVGLVQALELSAELGHAAPSLSDRVRRLLVALGLPVEPPRLPLATWWEPLTLDKKKESDSIRFVVCRKPGDVFDVRVPLVQIRSWLARQPYVELVTGEQRTVE